MKFSEIYKNSQIRLFISGTVFAVAFVWMAIYSYDVDEEVIRVFLILSIFLIGALIVCGFIFSLVFRFLRRRDKGILDHLNRRKKSANKGEDD